MQSNLYHFTINVIIFKSKSKNSQGKSFRKTCEILYTKRWSPEIDTQDKTLISSKSISQKF